MSKDNQPERAVDGTEDPFRPFVTGVFEAHVRAAVAAAESCDDAPDRAVHELRKAVRRARSVLQLGRRAMRKRQFNAIHASLRTAMRRVSVLRDQAVVLDALADVPTEGREERRALDALRRSLPSHRSRGGSAATSDVTKASLYASASECLASLSMLPQAWRDVVAYDDIYGELEASWSAARRAFALVQSSEEADPFHDWRKRTKIVRYQYAAIRSAGAGDKGLVRRLRGAALSQGAVTDLYVLRDAISALDETHDTLIVLAIIDRAAMGARYRTVDALRGLFELSPRRFAQRSMTQLVNGLLGTSHSESGAAIAPVE